MSSRISVALCTYNGARFLDAQLDSLLRQSRLPDELVARDDVSSDETVSILEDFAKTAPFPVHIAVNARNVGYVQNFEAAIRDCNGDLIALADQDDVWHTDKLARCERALLESPEAGAVFTNARIVDAELRASGRLLWDHYGFDAERRRRMRAGDAFAVLLQREVVTGATLVFRSVFRDLVLPIPEGTVHDAWIALMISAVAPLVLIEEPLIDYRQHASNQIGAAPMTLGARIAQARQVQQRTAATARAWHDIADDRLRASARFSATPEKLELLRRCRDHKHARATMPQSRLQRTLIVGRELLSGRYAKFSNGFRSAAMDLLL